MTMQERIAEIKAIIAEFNKDFDQFREGTNPNEPHCFAVVRFKGFDGNGFPTDNPEEFEIDEEYAG